MDGFSHRGQWDSRRFPPGGVGRPRLFLTLGTPFMIGKGLSGGRIYYVVTFDSDHQPSLIAANSSNFISCVDPGGTPSGMVGVRGVGHRRLFLTLKRLLFCNEAHENLLHDFNINRAFRLPISLYHPQLRYSHSLYSGVTCTSVIEPAHSEGPLGRPHAPDPHPRSNRGWNG